MKMKFELYRMTRPRAIAAVHLVITGCLIGSIAFCDRVIGSVSPLLLFATFVFLFPVGLLGYKFFAKSAAAELAADRGELFLVLALVCFVIHSYAFGYLLHFLLVVAGKTYRVGRKGWIWSKKQTGGMVRAEDRTEPKDGQLSSESALSDEVSS